jgi:hypothetical protein
MLSLNERLAWLLVVVLVITPIIWIDLPKLLGPAFILTLIVLSLRREWRRRHKTPKGPISN